MKRLVIDTNVLVSAAIVGRNPQAVILYIISNREQFEWVVSAEILTEYKTVLSRSKLKLTEADKQEWFSLLEDSTTIIDVGISLDFPRDRKDSKFLDCSVTAGADYLITGDQDFSEAQQLINTQIVSVYMFMQIFKIL